MNFSGRSVARLGPPHHSILRPRVDDFTFVSYHYPGVFVAFPQIIVILPFPNCDLSGKKSGVRRVSCRADGPYIRTLIAVLSFWIFLCTSRLLLDAIPQSTTERFVSSCSKHLDQNQNQNDVSRTVQFLRRVGQSSGSKSVLQFYPRVLNRGYLLGYLRFGLFSRAWIPADTGAVAFIVQ